MRITLLVLLVSVTPATAQYFPPVGSGEWQTVDRAGLGWNEDALPALESFLRESNTKAFVVLKDGRIAIETYFNGFDPDSTWIWYSAGKSLTAVLAGLALQEGLLTIDEPTTTYLGRWTLMTLEREERITLRHQLTMTTGLDESAFFCTLRICLTYHSDPGTRWVYHNAPYSLLRNVIEAVSGEDYTGFTVSRLGPAIGLEGRWEESGYNNFFRSTARAAARFGLMMAHGGMWDGTRVLTDTAYVRAMTSPSQDLNPAYGYLWWLNGQTSYIGPDDPGSVAGPLAPHAPDDAFVAAGSQGQFVAAAPGSGLVWVRMGEDPGGGLVPIGLHDEIWRRLLQVTGGGPTAAAPGPEAGRRFIELAPNPTAGAFAVITDAGARGTVRLVDLLGRYTGLSAPLTDGRALLDASGLATGTYVATVRTDHGVESRLVVVAR